MNLPSSTDSSLYQLAQEFNPSSNSLTVSNATFRGLTRALLNFLIARQLPVTVWFKLPWLDELERYHQQGKANQIYFCTTRREQITEFSTYFTSLTDAEQLAPFIPLVLESNSQLKREFYTIVLSPQFCCLLLAQKQIEQNLDNLKGSTSQSSWQVIYSFEPALIERILTIIKQLITVTDTTPEELLTSSSIPLTLPNSINSELMNDLLLQQIQQNESMQSDENLFDRSNQTINYLSESLQFKTEILKSLVQEISIPLTNMKTAIHLLDSRQSNKEHRQRYLDLLQRECERQGSIVTGLLELIAFDRTTGELETTQKLEDLIRGIVSTYQPLAQEKGITLGYTIPPELPSVSCPESWLRQILQNLLNNSLKYTPAEGRINVQAFVRPNRVELAVTDTGIGIDSSDISKIFNSFYRGRGNEYNSGAGLGLTVVKYLLKRCGGDISVTRTNDKRTIFMVVLPVVLAQEEG